MKLPVDETFISTFFQRVLEDTADTGQPSAESGDFTDTVEETES